MPDGSFQIRSFVNVDAPGCYVWSNPAADAALRAAGIAGDRQVLKIGYATHIRPAGAETAPLVYADLSGWQHWRCAMWERPENLDEMEKRLSRYFTPLNSEQRAVIYAALAPDVSDIPVGIKLYLGDPLDAAAHFPFCAETGACLLPARERRVPPVRDEKDRVIAHGAFHALFHGRARHA